MREPRYRFPDHVRDTTRTMASRMVQEDSVVRTPEELEAWIAEEPDVRDSLERGGYGTHFTAGDLFPLFEAFIAKHEGAPREAEESTRPSTSWWVVAAIIVLIVIVLVFVVAAGPLPQEVGAVSVSSFTAIGVRWRESI